MEEGVGGCSRCTPLSVQISHLGVPQAGCPVLQAAVVVAHSEEAFQERVPGERRDALVL